MSPLHMLPEQMSTWHKTMALKVYFMWWLGLVYSFKDINDRYYCSPNGYYRAYKISKLMLPLLLSFKGNMNTYARLTFYQHTPSQCWNEIFVRFICQAGWQILKERDRVRLCMLKSHSMQSLYTDRSILAIIWVQLIRKNIFCRKC